MYTGPNVTNDNLIFGYDTGYGIADTATSTRFYPGEPTTNLQSSNQTSSILNGMEGISIAHVGEEDGWQKYSMSGTFTSGTYPYIMNLSNTSFTGGTKYSTQVKIKTNVPGKFNYFGTGINYVNQPMDHGGTSSSTVLADGSRLAKREGFAYTSNQNQPGYLLTNPINNTTFSSSTDFVYVKDFQVEQQDHCTPFTASSRTNTTSLIDLKQTRDINVSNISFEGTGQPDFDGTDDFIAITDLLASQSIGLGTQLTISLWLNPDSHTSAMAFSTGQSGNDRIYFWTQSGLNTWRVNAYTSTTGHGSLPSIGNWFNTVLVINGLNITVYLNGVEDYTGTYTAFTTQNYATFGRHGATSSYYYNGNIAVARIYEKALSATEVLKDFNAYKKRFNI